MISIICPGTSIRLDGEAEPMLVRPYLSLDPADNSRHTKAEVGERLDCINKIALAHAIVSLGQALA